MNENSYKETESGESFKCIIKISIQIYIYIYIKYEIYIYIYLHICVIFGAHEQNINAVFQIALYQTIRYFKKALNLTSSP